VPVFRILAGQARPDTQDRIADLFREQAARVGRAEGLLFVQTLRSGDRVLGVSCWRGTAQMQHYLDQEETQEFYRRLPPLLMGMPSVRTYEVIASHEGVDGAGDPAAAPWISAGQR
jgi:quinol monooxygenase YgiN